MVIWRKLAGDGERSLANSFIGIFGALKQRHVAAQL